MQGTHVHGCRSRPFQIDRFRLLAWAFRASCQRHGSIRGHEEREVEEKLDITRCGEGLRGEEEQWGAGKGGSNGMGTGKKGEAMARARAARAPILQRSPDTPAAIPSDFLTPDFADNRYPFDPYDRIWQSYGDVASWTNITTAESVNVSNSGFNAPSAVLQSAATPVNGTQLDFSWSTDPSINNDDRSTSYLLLLYFAELQRLPSKALRKFDILVASWSGSRSYSPKYLFPEVVERMVVQGSGQLTVSLVATPDATLPPIVNAFEVYSVRQMTELATGNEDGT
ncbi:hypothetical protein QYE76_001632 [Lolium multiflorum]|uniref:Malectin-like domain-containing protein n=1 Tax=Lolium multiflorum TaxID=4521 RepID=A0AAD8VXI9_LOLMU|nr:hypothetical protein QYE76_001632 [Lolium multiflorum]